MPTCADARARAVRAWLRLPLGVDGIVEAVVGLDVALAGARVPGWAMSGGALGGSGAAVRA